MSLYYEAVRYISDPEKQRGTLKRRVFGDKTLKSNPAQVYGLVLEATKFASVLKEVIDSSGLLASEKKLTPELALLIVHDLLLSRKGIAAPQAHKLRQSVEKHKTRLNAELTRYRLKRGISSVEGLKSSLSNAFVPEDTSAWQGTDASRVKPAETLRHPRWVRINRLKTTLKAQLETTFKDYEQTDALDDILRAQKHSGNSAIFHLDKHIPDLLALPASSDLSKCKAYLNGQLILQDKASCFPAYLIDPDEEDEVVIDGCAAPGNKTTHLASLMSRPQNSKKEVLILSCERDKARAQILQKMVKIAGADTMTSIQSGQDFLKVDPHSEPWSNATSILLDPSCSGSGIIGRDEAPEKILLPSLPSSRPSVTKKRKRKPERGQVEPQIDLNRPGDEGDGDEEEEKSQDISKDRLESLGRFQARLVEHALIFPKARKITYSTCSIYEEENEHVVATVLASKAARQGGWRILRREEQVDGMKRWDVRGTAGDASQSKLTKEIVDACIRCEKHTSHGTQGFFVAGFIRDTSQGVQNGGEDSEEEWEGFQDD